MINGNNNNSKLNDLIEWQLDHYKIKSNLYIFSIINNFENLNKRIICNILYLVLNKHCTLDCTAEWTETLSLMKSELLLFLLFPNTGKHWNTILGAKKKKTFSFVTFCSGFKLLQYFVYIKKKTVY